MKELGPGRRLTLQVFAGRLHRLAASVLEEVHYA